MPRRMAAPAHARIAAAKRKRWAAQRAAESGDQSVSAGLQEAEAESHRQEGDYRSHKNSGGLRYRRETQAVGLPHITSQGVVPGATIQPCPLSLLKTYSALIPNSERGDPCWEGDP
jgi:hypothetical protein